MPELDLTGIPKVSSPEDNASVNLKGIPKDPGFNLSGIPKQDGTISGPAFRALPDNFKMRKATPQEDQADFDFAVQRMADQMFTASTGMTPEQGIEAQQKLNNIISRGPRLAMAFVSPLMAAGFEALQQVKNVVADGIQKKKYSPFEQRLLTELLPEDLPKPVKVGANVAEILADIALMGGASNLAKKGLLEDTIKTIGGKLEKAGYGTGQVTLNRDKLAEVAKGTSLEDETKLWLKSKLADIKPKFNLPEPSPNVPTGLPTWSGAFGETNQQAAENIRKVVTASGGNLDKIAETIKKGIIIDNFTKPAGKALPLPDKIQILDDLNNSGFTSSPVENEKFNQFLNEQEINNPNEDLNFSNSVGSFIRNERGSVNLPDLPIRENLSKFKELLGKEFVRGYGLTPEARLAFTNLRESQELNEMEIIDLLKKNVQVSEGDAKLLTYHLENPEKYPIPSGLVPQAQFIRKSFDTAFEELKKRNLLSEKFPQTFINKLEGDIESEKEVIKTLNDGEAIQRHQEKINELNQKIDFLKKLNYVPHQYKPLIESQVIKLFSEGKISHKLISRPSRIIGREIATLDDAKEAGLIPEEDIRVLMGSYLNYVKNKVAIHDFIESLKTNESIVMPEKKAPEDWKKIPISQLDGFKVHPYLSDALRDYAITSYDKTGLILGAYDHINKLSKTILFYNPMIMSLNNLQQTYLAGGMNKNLPKDLWDSVKDLKEQTDFYKDSVKAGLFAAPYNTRPRIEDQIKLWIDESEKSYPALRKIVRLANPAEIYSELNKVTWNLDRIMRLAQVKHFMSKGMPFQKAVDRTNLFFVDYSMTPDHLRRQLNRVFLTPTYRMGIMRMYYNFARHPIENRGAIGRLIGFWIATGLFAAWQGYRIENGYRLVRKLKTPIETPDHKILEEQVFALPSPLFEYQKIFGRSASRNLYLNLARVPYIAASLAKNKDWKGDPIVDKALPIGDRSRQQIYYILKTYVAPVEAFESLSGQEQSAIEKVLNMLAISVYKRQGQTKFLINQVEGALSDLRDYRRRHPNASDEELRKVQLETQRRIDSIMKRIAEYERNGNE